MNEKIELTLQKLARSDATAAERMRAFIEGDDSALAEIRAAGKLDWSDAHDLRNSLPEDEHIVDMGEPEWRLVRLLAAVGEVDDLFQYWLNGSLYDEGEHDYFSRFTAEMHAAGLDDDAFLRGVAKMDNYSRRGGDGRTSLARHALTLSREGLLTLASHIRGEEAGVGLLRLLLDAAPDDVDAVFAALLAGNAEESEKAAFCHPMMQARGEKVAEKVNELLGSVSEEAPRLSLAKLLCEHDESTYLVQLLDTARKSLPSRDYWVMRQKPHLVLIERLGARAVDDIVDFVKAHTNDSHACTKAVVALTEATGAAALPAINELMQNDGDCRLTGCQLLVEIDEDREHCDRIHDALIAGVTDADNDRLIDDYARLALDWDRATMVDELWKLMEHKSKKVRDGLSEVLRQEGDAVARAAALLASKKAPARESAVAMLVELGADAAQRALADHLGSERSEKLKKVIQKYLGVELPQPAAAATDLGTLVQKTLKKIKKPIAKWLPAKLPDVVLQDGNKLDADTVKYLLYRQSKAKGIESDEEAAPLLSQVDRKQSGDFASAVLNAMLKAGGEARDKWALALAGLVGDDRIVAPLDQQILKWAKAGRGKMAEHAVHALALLGSDAALMVIDDARRRFAHKYTNIGDAAAEAFNAAAKRLGVSKDELADRVVPTLGFDQRREIEIGDRTIELSLGLDLKIAYRDVDKDKPLKSLPKGVAADVKEELKGAAKLLRQVAKAQTDRLETLMSRQYRWPIESWRSLYTSHPVLERLAEQLVWGHYPDEGGELASAFRLRPDGSLADLEENAVAIDSGHVGIVHPIELADDVREAWKGFLARAQPFLQLGRRVFVMAPEDEKKTLHTDASGRTVDGYAFRNRSEKLGWERGEVGDAGAVYTISKSYPAAGLTATIRVDGYGAMVWGDVTIQELFFERTGKERWWSYDAPLGNEDSLVPFSLVPALVWSETISDLEQIAP